MISDVARIRLESLYRKSVAAHRVCQLKASRSIAERCMTPSPVRLTETDSLVGQRKMPRSHFGPRIAPQTGASVDQVDRQEETIGNLKPPKRVNPRLILSTKTAECILQILKYIRSYAPRQLRRQLSSEDSHGNTKLSQQFAQLLRDLWLAGENRLHNVTSRVQARICAGVNMPQALLVVATQGAHNALAEIHGRQVPLIANKRAVRERLRLGLQRKTLLSMAASTEEILRGDLCRAVASGDRETFTRILNTIVVVDGKAKCAGRPLCVSLHNGRFDMAKQLLGRGANPNFRICETSPHMMSVLSYGVNIVCASLCGFCFVTDRTFRVNFRPSPEVPWKTTCSGHGQKTTTWSGPCLFRNRSSRLCPRRVCATTCLGI